MDGSYLNIYESGNDTRSDAEESEETIEETAKQSGTRAGPCQGETPGNQADPCQKGKAFPLFSRIGQPDQ